MNYKTVLSMHLLGFSLFCVYVCCQGLAHFILQEPVISELSQVSLAEEMQIEKPKYRFATVELNIWCVAFNYKLLY